MITALPLKCSLQNILLQFPGHQVPRHLDPLTRKRGKKGLVEDGPVTLANGSVDPRAIVIPNTTMEPTKVYVSKEYPADKYGHATKAIPLANSSPVSVLQPNLLKEQPLEVLSYECKWTTFCKSLI